MEPPLDKYAIHKIWAPEISPWSPWVKPVLFAHRTRALPRVSIDCDRKSFAWIPRAFRETVWVLDLPGVESVSVGMQMAKAGHRPIPLFASCPPALINHPPSGEPPGPGDEFPCTVDAASVLAALVEAAPILKSINLLVDAPPVFLLDSLRSGRSIDREKFYYDNRSVVFESDFPSCQTLRNNGIQRCCILRDGRRSVAADLAQALVPWRRAGLEIHMVNIDGNPLPLRGFGTGPFHTLFRWLQTVGVQRNADGGFVRPVAPASS